MGLESSRFGEHVKIWGLWALGGVVMGAQGPLADPPWAILPSGCAPVYLKKLLHSLTNWCFSQFYELLKQITRPPRSG